MRKDTLPVDHFEQLYAKRPDPWHLATSDYERAKYAATLAALPREHYRHGLEIGCANGIFTAALAGRCEALLAIEPVETALDAARRYNADRPNVRFARMFVPAEWPAEPFDLIVLSEVIDYIGATDIGRLADRVHGSLAPAGDMILVHWIGKKSSRPRGDEATDRLVACLGSDFTVLHADRNADYRLDLLRRA